MLEFVPASFKLLIEERETVVCPKCEDPVSMDRADSDSLSLRRAQVLGCWRSSSSTSSTTRCPWKGRRRFNARLGVELSTSTLGDWFAFGIDCLRPLYDAVVMEVKKDFRMNVDDTGLLALDRQPEGAHKGHLWAHRQRTGGLQLHADVGRKGTGRLSRQLRRAGAGGWYKGFEKKLSGGSEDPLRVVPEERRLGCLMHLRGKFRRGVQGGEIHEPRRR